MIDFSIYAARRKKVLDAMLARTGGGVAIVHTAPEVVRNGNSEHAYRHDSSFYYLTGFTEPEATLVLLANADGSAQSILFCRAKNAEREIWDGYRYGPDAACAAFGFTAAYPSDALSTAMPVLLANQPAVYYKVADNAATDAAMQGWLDTIRAQARSGQTPPLQAIDIRLIVDEMRLVKSAPELDIMRQAGKISAAAHVRAMQFTRPGVAEYQIEAEMLHTFRMAGAAAPAYTSIVATGANSCVLHYRAGKAVCGANDMVLIDAACEYEGYASDITRAFPANGVFSPEQKAVYEIVLAAQTAAVSVLRAGAGYNDYHVAATRVLAQGMVDLGFLTGSVDSVIESGKHQQFYMHKTGHWLGMDVHDCGDYRDPNVLSQRDAEGKPIARPFRTLQAGMVMTVEPGFYIRPADNVPPAFWNIGVRIEDDAIITPTGCELMTRGVPVAVAEIEAIMKAGREAREGRS